MARLLHLSDLHAAAPGVLVSGVLDAAGLLRDAIDMLLTRLDAIGPLDAVLVTGDISHDGDAESYAVARAELDRLGLPLLALPGNHDRREALRGAFADVPGMPDEGLIDWVVDLPGCRVVGLDTLIEGKGGGRLREESLALLRHAIAEADGRDLIVALHHPPIRTGIRFMDAITLENPGALADALSGVQGALRIVAGHVHGVFHGQIGGFPVSTAPATCSAFAFDRRAAAPVGFMTGPRACAVLESGADGIWTVIPLEPASGPCDF